MAIKPFEIQSSTLTIGGVDLQAGTTGVVIPGVTQAVNYRVEEVDDTGNQTYNDFPLDDDVYAIDAAIYNTVVADGNISAFATYVATTDGDGYIDNIEVDGQGTYTQQQATTASSNNMYVWIGTTGNANDRPLVPEDWVQVPFRPKMRAGEVENLGGGSGGVVERSVSFPYGEEGDTKGTLALDPDGLMICVADWANQSEYGGTYGVTTSEVYAIGQSGGDLNAVTILAEDYPEIAYIVNTADGQTAGNWLIDAGGDYGGVQTCTGVTTNPGTITFYWPHRTGVDPEMMVEGYEADIIWDGPTVQQAEIWELATSGDIRFEGSYIRSAFGGEFGHPTITNSPDASAEDGGVEIQFNSDTVNHAMWLNGEDGLAIHINSHLNEGPGNDNSTRWYFSPDGALTFPDGTKQTTAGGGTSISKWIAAGGSPGGSALLHSTNGTTWTTQDYMMNGQSINRVAIGAGRIVYLMSLDGPGDAIYYTSAPETTPTMATGTDAYQGNDVFWSEINYLGGKFVAVGSARSDNNTVSTGIASISLAGGGRTYPRIDLTNVDYNYSGKTITITGAANTELNGTFVLEYNSLDEIRTGVYDLTLDGGGVPTITSNVITGATVSNLTNVSGRIPIFAYSTNGVAWTYGDLDPAYVSSFGGPEAELEMSDVAYDGTGYLIPVTSDQFGEVGDGGHPFAYGPGAFYITDLTAEVSEGQFIQGEDQPGGLPGNFNNIAAYGDGTFFISDDEYAVWTGNPNIGWTPHSIVSALVDAYGWEPDTDGNDGNDVDSAVAGTVGGTEYWVGTTNAGMVISTSDQCDTFQVSIPDPLTSSITDIIRGTTTTIEFTDATPAGDGEKIVISGVTTQQGEPGTTNQSYNGTYYIKSNMGDYELYTDSALTTPWNTTSYWPVNQNTGTITWGHGEDLDAIHVADGVCVVYSSEAGKLYRSTDLINWTSFSIEGPYGVDDIYFGSVLSAATDTLASGEFEVVLNDDGSITFPTKTFKNWEDVNETGPTLQLGNDPTSQVLITGPAPTNSNADARRLVIQGQQGYGGEGNSKGEGGDVYIWAGSGGDGGSLSNRGNGGDVKLRGGRGGTEGGYIRLESGDAQATDGTGGFLDLNAGNGVGTGGYGGDVNIRAGQGGAVDRHGEVMVETYGGTWYFRNDGKLESPAGGDVGAELIGNGGFDGNNSQYTLYTDFHGTQTGGADNLTGLELDVDYNFQTGWTITFRNGEIRTINNVGAVVDGYVLVEWSGDTVSSGYDNPAFPIVVTPSDYVPAAKPTARIKPDGDFDDYDQYMDIYTGGPSLPDDLGHIHMKGHTGNIELFLGTDDNFVSTKEAGTRPGHVTMRSETEIKVIETDIRTTRNGSTFIGNYGDGHNYFWNRDNDDDISHNCVAVDPAGNYYIGGEHQQQADGMFSKFSKDGELLWSKVIGGSPSSDAWDVTAVAYNPALDQVAFACSTDLDRSHNYIKLITFDATTGEDLNIARDYFDIDNDIYATHMKYHPTLGWVIVGVSYGEEVVLSGLSPQPGSGAGRLVLDKESTRILGDLMVVGNTTWKISGTNISGKQTLSSAIGLFRLQNPVPVTVANPGANGLSVDVRIDYTVGTSGTFETFAAINSAGSDYTDGDQVKVPGSLLGGVDAGTTVNATAGTAELESGQVELLFPKPSYPNLYKQLKWTGYTATYDSNTYEVVDIVTEGNSWKVIIDSVVVPVSLEIAFYTADGNDVTFTLQVDGSGGVTGAGAITGNPNVSNITIDMFTLGYPGDFSSGTYNIVRQVNGRPIVLNSSWRKFLDLEDGNAYEYGQADSLYIDGAGDIFVGGAIQSSINGGNGCGFIWKLSSNGSTQWAKGLPSMWSVNSLAVSSVGDIYAVAQGMGTDLFVLGSTGNLLLHKEPDGPFYGALHLDITHDAQGAEHVYLGWGGFNAPFAPSNGFLVQKFTINTLEPVWSRFIGTDGQALNVNYDSSYQHFVLTPTQATIVGYGRLLSDDNDDALIVSLSITDDFEAVPEGVNGIITLVLDIQLDNITGSVSTDLIALGVAGLPSTVEYDSTTTGITWYNHRFQNRIIDANASVKGLVGIENIKFINGDNLDHNPSDIPESTQNLQIDDSMNWNITLRSSDRGKFIKNKVSPDYGPVQDLKVYIPESGIDFPIGSIITLINLDTTGTYKITVEPEGFGGDNGHANLWVPGQTSSSIWSFTGLQTATLMKVSQMDWVLTANDVTNED